MPIAIEPAAPGDFAAVEALLVSSGLPLDGLREHFGQALVARLDGRVIGSAALERYGQAALLRSVAVASGLRGLRLGERLVRAALGVARQQGMGEVYLLTTTADAFFPRFGFQPVEREAVNPAVRASVEFTLACPSSARALRLAPVPALAVSTRHATTADAAAIAEIYNQGIADRVGTFETRERDKADILAWFDGQHPIVVAEDDTGVVAFASTSAYRARECYAGITEFSVYVARAARGQGVGRVAMLALIDAAAAAGFWKLLSRVFVENSGSRALLRSLGFREVGVYEKHGRLDGAWRDVVIVERLIEANL